MTAKIPGAKSVTLEYGRSFSALYSALGKYRETTAKNPRSEIRNIGIWMIIQRTVFCDREIGGNRILDSNLSPGICSRKGEIGGNRLILRGEK